jgi:exodeoxyribonuclease VII large subunit
MSSFFDLPFEEPPDEEPVDETRPARVRTILTVSELTAQIRTTLERQFFEMWVEGELSNCKVWNNGHLYFTLKDQGAQIRGVMFRGSLRFLRFTPKDGMRVTARGRVTVYDPRGEYQLLCEHFEPEGLGARQLAFEQLKERLTSEGLFDPRRKRALPALPRKIGVVTSLDGAAVRDVIRVLRRRYANAHIVIRPARVQGDGAAMEIARALTAICKVQGVDVVIVGRGGGSIEDLWAFNEEVVARAIAGCAVPTISAVGHETDVTIADFVADLRAPTPSAAAELVVARKDEVQARIDRLSQRLDSGQRSRLHRLEARLRSLETRPGYGGFHGRVLMRSRRATELTTDLRDAMMAGLDTRARRHRALRAALDTFDLRHRLAAVRARLQAATSALDAGVSRRRMRLEGRLGSAAARLDSLSPLAVLGRGYAVAWDDSRTHVLRRASDTAPGETVRVRLHEGELRCDVREIIGGTNGNGTDPKGSVP